VRQGEPAKRFYFIKQGKAEVVVRTRSGKEFVLSELVKGQYFGETGLLNGAASIATIKAPAGEELEVGSIDSDSFNDLIARSETARAEIEKVSLERLLRNTEADTKDTCHVPH
jgi:CRP-like cAMP-binding protein